MIRGFRRYGVRLVIFEIKSIHCLLKWYLARKQASSIKKTVNLRNVRNTIETQK